MYNVLIFCMILFYGCKQQSRFKNPEWEEILQSAKKDYDNGQQDLAIADIHKAIVDMGPSTEGYIELHHALYGFYRNQEKWKEALPPLQKSILALESSNIPVSRKKVLLIDRYSSITLLYSLNKDLPKAIESRKKIVQLLKEIKESPERIFMQYLLLGDLCRSAQEKEEATNSYAQAQQFIDRGLVPIERQEELTTRMSLLQSESP